MRTGTLPTVPNRSAPWELEDSPTPVWPFLSRLELEAATGSVPSARRHAHDVAMQWGLKALADDVELTVSELVTNAVEAAVRTWPAFKRSPAPVRLWLASDLDAILVRVWDSSPEMPIRRDNGLYDERGRGLVLVAALCRAWGMYSKGTGKVIWVVI